MALPLPFPAASPGWKSILESARLRVCRVDRVLCGVLLSLRVEKTPGLGTLGVTRDGRLLVDPGFIERFRGGLEAELTRILVHEALHVLLLHPQRCEKLRDRNLCNMAADAIVEATIDAIIARDASLARTIGFADSRGAIVAPRYGGEYHRGLMALRGLLSKCGVDWDELLSTTLEEVYRRLEECSERIEASLKLVDVHPWGGSAVARGGGGGGGGGGDRLGEAARLAARMVEEGGEGFGAGFSSKLPGVLRGEWERVVELLGARVKLDWRQVLQRILDRYVPTDYTWLRPSRRSQALGVYLPGPLRRAWSLGVILDTSGSILEDEYREFLEALRLLLQDRPVQEVILAEADVELQRVERFEDPPPPTVLRWASKRRGYGGTFFHIPIQQLLEKHPHLDLLIYFTDGYGVYPREPPRVPIVWVLSRRGARPGTRFWPPFGHIVKIQ